MPNLSGHLLLEDHQKLSLQKCHKDIGMFSVHLATIIGEILAMPDEDTAHLAIPTLIRQCFLIDLPLWRSVPFHLQNYKWEDDCVPTFLY